jgi:hypothetical protein
VKLRYPAPVRLRPVPLPPLTLIERLTFISTAMHADDVVDTDTLNVLDEISAAMAAVDNPHPLRMALAPILAQMTEDQT